MGIFDRFRRWFQPEQPTTLGGRGEQAAVDHLKQAGYRIIARNHQTGIGEIDILADDVEANMVVVVEVKTARGDAPPPEIHVNAAKQRKLAQLAACLAKQRRFADRAIRFDVIGVVWPDDAEKPTRVTHHRGAFESNR